MEKIQKPAVTLKLRETASKIRDTLRKKYEGVLVKMVMYKPKAYYGYLHTRVITISVYAFHMDDFHQKVEGEKAEIEEEFFRKFHRMEDMHCCAPRSAYEYAGEEG